jgi:hypothetical protein
MAGGAGSNQYRKEVALFDTRPPQKTISEYGISWDQSSKWQKLAAVPKAVFEGEFAKKDMPRTLDGILDAAAATTES